jgi:hypothetical protein
MENTKSWEIPFSLRKESFGGKYLTRTTYVAGLDLRGIYEGLWRDYIGREVKSDEDMKRWIETKRGYQEKVFREMEDRIKESLSLVANPNMIEVSVIPSSGLPETSSGVGQVYISLVGEDVGEDLIKDSILYSLSRASKELLKEVEKKFGVKTRGAEKIIKVYRV